MRAAQWHGPRDIRVEEVQKPTAGPGEVVLKVAAAGICGSDLHEYVSGPHFLPIQEPHPLTGHSGPPFILGHEMSGTIDEKGSGVAAEWEVGRSVAVMPLYYCGSCHYCQRAMYGCCENVGWLGLHSRWGAFAEYVVVNENMLLTIPAEVSLDHAALTEPANVAFSSVSRSGITVGSSVLITGGGPIGCLHALTAKAAGATQIFVSEVLKGRLELLAERDFGITETLNPREVDLEREIRDRTHGVGVDVAIDCTGTQPGITDCCRCLTKGGTFIVCGLPTAMVAVDFVQWASNHVQAMCTWGYQPYDFPRVLDMMGHGLLPVDRVVTKRIGIEDIVEEGFEFLSSDEEGRQLKVLVEFD